MAKPITAAVFADGGATPHNGQYRYAGETLARNGGVLVCLAHEGRWPLGLVDAALGLRGDVTVVTTPGHERLRVPQGVKVELAENRAAAALHAINMADVIVGLPARLDTNGLLYSAWVAAGGAGCGKPVGLLNRNQAFEVVRGFIADVANVGRGNTDSLIQFSESFDDLWTRLTRLVG